MKRRNGPAHVLMLGVLCLSGWGCSINRIAINKLGNALAGGGSTYASDSDPELIRDATPFTLKLMETLLAEAPRHRGLLLAAASGFTQYSYAFVHLDADEMEDFDLDAAEAGWNRAASLYLRARDYGLRGLEVEHEGFRALMMQDPALAVALTDIDDVPLLYWTAVSWAGAITLSKDDTDLIGELPTVGAFIDRALELNESWEAGSIHTFLISYEMARQAEGDPVDRSRGHFERAMELTGGQSAQPLVALAEAVSVPQQDADEFRSLLNQALAIDPDQRAEWRMINLVTQRRARWLLDRLDYLILE